MRILLDTHIVIWALAQDAKLGRSGNELLANAEYAVVSAVSAWEFAMKFAAGKLTAPTDFHGAATRAGFHIISLDFDDAAEYAQIPRHHTDPFDRMLVAQARLRGLTIATRDRQFEGYDVPIAWV